MAYTITGTYPAYDVAICLEKGWLFRARCGACGHVGELDRGARLVEKTSVGEDLTRGSVLR
jgi:hypothetical protein